MIKVIIFSFDRAMQLSLLLESLELYDSKKRFSVSVLYSFSVKEYEQGYEILKKRYSNIEWIKEVKFKKAQLNFSFDFTYLHNFYWWLKNKNQRRNKSNFKESILSCLKQSDNSLVMFLTDDSLFIEEIFLPEAYLTKILESPQLSSFSLRHGTNLAGGNYLRIQSDLIEWNVYHNDISTDWGYPFSVDGHIYNKEIIEIILGKIIFNNPNTLEGNVATYVREKQLFSQLYANNHNSLVGFELNRVQNVVDNNNLGISQEELNQYFLDGYIFRISYNTPILYFRPEVIALFAEKAEKQICLYQKSNVY